VLWARTAVILNSLQLLPMVVGAAWATLLLRHIIPQPEQVVLVVQVLTGFLPQLVILQQQRPVRAMPVDLTTIRQLLLDLQRLVVVAQGA
jgi:hypothetical protein